MATNFFLFGLGAIQDGSIRLGVDTLKLMLVDETYVYDPELEVVDNGEDDTSDPSACELDATGYTAGHAGAGRKTVSVDVNVNYTDSRVEFVVPDTTWTALGGTTNGTVGGAILFKEGANDADSVPLAFYDVADTPTNGGSITLDFAASGNLHLTLES